MQYAMNIALLIGVKTTVEGYYKTVETEVPYKHFNAMIYRTFTGMQLQPGAYPEFSNSGQGAQPEAIYIKFTLDFTNYVIKIRL
jgi:hypothetical protein